jgi:hypothetical protein
MCELDTKSGPAGEMNPVTRQWTRRTGMKSWGESRSATGSKLLDTDSRNRALTDQRFGLRTGNPVAHEREQKTGREYFVRTESPGAGRKSDPVTQKWKSKGNRNRVSTYWEKTNPQASTRPGKITMRIKRPVNRTQNKLTMRNETR